MGRARRAIAAGTIAASIVGGAPAGANGFDRDSHWGDEVQLQAGGAVSTGNVVGMWQEILSVEFGLNETNVDGIYGSGTANYTAVFQSQYGIAIDGVVGPQTWNVARFVAGTTISLTPCSHCYYDYGGGTDLQLYWRNTSGGTWKWSGNCYAASASPPSGFGLTDHPISTFTRC